MKISKLKLKLNWLKIKNIQSLSLLLKIPSLDLNFINPKNGLNVFEYSLFKFLKEKFAKKNNVETNTYVKGMEKSRANFASKLDELSLKYIALLKHGIPKYR